MNHLLLIDKENVSQCVELLRNFEIGIFLPSFPMPDEREPFDEIIKRINHPVNDVVSYCILSLDENDNVTGGMVLDWYPLSSSLEIIYLAVSEKYRGQKIGSVLRYDGLRMALDRIDNIYGKAPKRVYLEVEFPSDEIATSNGFTSSARMNIWLHWGARVIPINYCQPPLENRQNEVSNLVLMAIPFNNERGIPKSDLKNFLTEFYNGLGALKSDRLVQIQNEVDMWKSDEIAYENFDESACWGFGAGTEKESNLSQTAIVWHFAYSGNAIWGDDDRNCNVLNSYECDLMNFVNQRERPFKTHFIKVMEDVCIKLPEFYSYVSEGRVNYRKSLNTQIQSDISLSYAYAPKTNVRIVNMVIRPRNANEMDILKLLNAFGSLQEDYSPDRQIEMSVNNGESLPVADFLAVNVKVGEYHLLNLGLSEFDGWIFDFNVKKSKNIRERNKLLCGFMSGIFDFGRMNLAEIKDTVKPIVSFGDCEIYVFRGHLMKINKCGYDPETPAVLFVSPYVLVLSEALALDECYLRQGEKFADMAMKRRWLISAAYKNIAVSQNLIINGYLSDIFHYPSEKLLFDEADKQRSLSSRRDEIQNKIDIVRRKCENGANAILEGILAVIALCQINDIFTRGSEIGATFQFFVVTLIIIYIIRFIRIMGIGK